MQALNLLKQKIADTQIKLGGLVSEFHEMDKQNFIKVCGKPIYDYLKFKEKPLNKTHARETETELWDTGTVSLHTRNPVSIWVCKFCKTPLRRKYIATYHDHTDYSYDVCDCKGAKGKPWEELQ